MLSSEEVEKVKQALLNQIEGMDISEDEKDKAAARISQMTPEQLESFVKPKCIFCGISQGQIESFKLAENSEAVVVLEINPMSKGHSLLIPKKHVSLAEFPMNVYELLQETIKNLKAKLSPKEISISSSEAQGHVMINILPLSGNETGKREKASKEQLEELIRLLRFEAKKESELKLQPKPEVKQELKEPEVIIEKAPVRVP